MEILKSLQLKNPQIGIKSVNSEDFFTYGKLYSDFDASALITACERAVTLPLEGVIYKPSLTELESLPGVDKLSRECFGQMPIQCGVCMGHNQMLGGLEYHKSSEINIAVTDMILLLGDQRDIDQNNRLDSRRVKAFYLQKGDVVELFATTLHFAPCGVRESFCCIVVLPVGTNTALDSEPAESDPLLWARNKWLLAHEQNETLIQRGVKPGIYNENWKVYPLQVSEE